MHLAVEQGTWEQAGGRYIDGYVKSSVTEEGGKEEVLREDLHLVYSNTMNGSCEVMQYMYLCEGNNDYCIHNIILTVLRSYLCWSRSK